MMDCVVVHLKIDEKNCEFRWQRSCEVNFNINSKMYSMSRSSKLLKRKNLKFYHSVRLWANVFFTSCAENSIDAVHHFNSR